MSIQSEINRITGKRDQSFTELSNKGVSIQSGSTIDDLPGYIAALPETIKGSGAPTTSTAGLVGQHYFNTSATESPYEYVCTDATGGVYTWEPIGAMSKWVKLWENASPNSVFLPQTISVALSGFEFIAIVFHQYGDNTNPYGISLGLTNFYGSLYDHEGFRRFTANASSVAFEEGSIRTGGTVAANNQVLLPYQIYGIKGVVNA